VTGWQNVPPETALMSWVLRVRMGDPVWNVG